MSYKYKVNVHISEDEYEDLTNLAQETGASVNALVCRGLEEMLDTPESVPEAIRNLMHPAFEHGEKTRPRTHGLSLPITLVEKMDAVTRSTTISREKLILIGILTHVLNPRLDEDFDPNQTLWS